MFTLLYVLFLCSGVQALYSVITPTSFDISGYTGESFPIQANNSDLSPSEYLAAALCDYGSTSPASFTFDITSEFTQTSSLKGKCNITFSVSPGGTFGFGLITIFSMVNITSSVSIVAANSGFLISATTPYPGPGILHGNVNCTIGDPFIVNFISNSGLQTIQIPGDVAGNCTMTPTTATTDSYYTFDPFYFQVFNPNQMTVISPPDDSSNFNAYSGGTFPIEVDNSGFFPQTYVSNMDGGSYPGGSFSPNYTFAYNSSFQFLVQNTTRGTSTVYFNVSTGDDSINFATRLVNVFAAVVITTNMTEVKAGDIFYYNATSNYTLFQQPIVGSIFCTTGSTDTLVNVNNGEVQTVTIPAGASGNCTMSVPITELISFFYIIPFDFAVSNEISIEVVSAAAVQAGGTVILLISTNTYVPVSANLILTCPIGGNQTENITTAANSTDYTLFAVGENLSGNCQFSLSEFPEIYTSGTAAITVLTQAPAMQVYLPFFFPQTEPMMATNGRRRLQKNMKRKKRKARF